MKLSVIIDKERDEEIIIYTHEKNALISAIEQMVESDLELIGYNDTQTVKLNLTDIYCFTVEDNKVYATTQNEKLRMRCRLYELERLCGDKFIKINQSCIVGITKIERFDASFRGSMKITLKNGYTDYISRRQLKNVKERLGL